MTNKRASPAYPARRGLRNLPRFHLAGIDSDASLRSIIRRPILTIQGTLPGNIWAGHARTYTRTATGYKLTWPASDYTDSFDRTDTHHPGPWDIAGYKLELPDAITWFDTHTVTPGKPPVDIVWEMRPPAP